MAKKERADTPAGEASHIEETIRILLARRDEAQAEAIALGEAVARLTEIAGGKVTQIDRPRSGPYRYAGLSVIEAIELYLERKECAASRDELRDEVVTGGAMVGHDPRYVAGNVKKSIDKNQQTEPARLRELNGMVGLSKWTDEKFQTSGT